LNTVFLSLGSNLGNTYEYLNTAVQELFGQVGPVIKISPVYASPALGFEGPDFHNCIVKIVTNFTPGKLLKKIQAIEKDLGRERSGKGYESRNIDIDILLYNDEVIDSKNLQVPHSKMLERKFVLQPLDNYIAIEGNIGAGKTSLAELISQEFNAKLILERFKDNPFLPKFYEEPGRYAFPLEMSFLADRYQQLLDDIGQFDLFKDFMIADYDRYKSLIFAQVTLQDEEFVLYKRLHEMMYRDMPQPDLYVYLYQNTERLLENIKKRGRDYEKSIKREYLDKINKGYLEFIKSQHHLNVKVIDISELDFVKNREDYLELISQF